MLKYSEYSENIHQRWLVGVEVLRGQGPLAAGDDSHPLLLALLAVGLCFPECPLTREVKGKFFLDK